MVPGKEPLVAYPDASGRLLYSLDSSIVPGVSGDPTNLGADPYVAVRGNSGWTTTYAGPRPVGWPIRVCSDRPCSKPAVT